MGRGELGEVLHTSGGMTLAPSWGAEPRLTFQDGNFTIGIQTSEMAVPFDPVRAEIHHKKIINQRWRQRPPQRSQSPSITDNGPMLGTT